MVSNVELPLELRGAAAAERRSAALEALDMVGLAAFAKAYPRQLLAANDQIEAAVRAALRHDRLADLSGLAVIGAIVGEFIAGIGGLRGGLGYVIISAANRLDMPYLFASALTSSLLGIIIFIGISLVSARFLRHWHESAVRREA